MRVHFRRTPAWAEATLLVLPFSPFGQETVAGILADLGAAGDGDHWSADWPFVDLATGNRFADTRSHRTLPWWKWAWRWYVDTLGQFLTRPVPAPPGHASGQEGRRNRRRVDAGMAGYGLPFQLDWPVPPWAARQLLSVAEEDGVRRREVTGHACAAVRLRQAAATITVEALGPDPEPFLRSSIFTFTARVRGLLPLAGNPAAQPDTRDGRGIQARFQAPCGIVRVAWTPHDPGSAPRRRHAGSRYCKWLVADPDGQVLRLVDPDGDVKTLWGWAGQPGLQNGLPGEVLFNRPTFLAVEPVEGKSVVVADSGNHVIRLLKASGQVSTLAGIPGCPGHRDSTNPGGVRFNGPRGLAVDRHLQVFVADGGNYVIRKISAAGAVTTLAGSPGLPGSVDGQGAEARFLDLQGMALDHAGNLYVVDGHGVRQVTPGGRVTTLLGDPCTPGCLEAPDGAGPASLSLAGVPCLNRPVGLAGSDGHLFIADQGNQAIRDYDLRTGALTTLAGGPQAQGEEPVLRWGLLRDGVPGPLDERYAALDQPRGLVWDPEGQRGRLLVTTGCCVAQLTAPLAAPPPSSRIHGAAQARVGEPFTVLIHLDPGDGAGAEALPPAPTLHGTVEFIDPDGTMAQCSQASLAAGETLQVVGTFLEAGEGTVRYRGVTDTGVSQWAERKVAIQEAVRGQDGARRMDESD